MSIPHHRVRNLRRSIVLTRDGEMVEISMRLVTEMYLPFQHEHKNHGNPYSCNGSVHTLLRTCNFIFNFPVEAQIPIWREWHKWEKWSRNKEEAEFQLIQLHV